MSTDSRDKSDLYQILGVARTADADEIKRAYRALAKQYHPDLNPGNKAAEEKFKEISAAFAVLGDETKRAAYDEFGPDGLREGFDPEAARNYKRWEQSAGGGRGRPFDLGGGAGRPGGFGGLGGFGDLDELLGNLFGGGMGGRRSRTHRRGDDTEAEVTLSVRDALNGTEVRVSGSEAGGRVRIPPGVATGQKIRVAGQGGHGPAGRGDLFIKVSVAPPVGFRIVGERNEEPGDVRDDLEIDLPLTIAQAMLGAAVTVPTPEGTTVQLKVPAGTQSGQRLRLRGKGMPRKGGERSDLFARALVRIPRTDAPRAAELAAELDTYYS